MLLCAKRFAYILLFNISGGEVTILISGLPFRSLSSEASDLPKATQWQNHDVNPSSRSLGLRSFCKFAIATMSVILPCPVPYFS